MAKKQYPEAKKVIKNDEIRFLLQGTGIPASFIASLLKTSRQNIQARYDGTYPINEEYARQFIKALNEVQIRLDKAKIALYKV